MKKLPPFGQQYMDELPRSGVEVAMGLTASDFAKMQPRIVMVLPFGADPFEFKWPMSDGAYLHERGQFDDKSLTEMATALLVAGNKFVAARREAQLDSDPMVWFYEDSL